MLKFQSFLLFYQIIDLRLATTPFQALALRVYEEPVRQDQQKGIHAMLHLQLKPDDLL